MSVPSAHQPSPAATAAAEPPDEPRPELSQDDALAPAPERVDDLFAVPRID